MSVEVDTRQSASLFDELQRLGARVWLDDGENLHVLAPEGTLDETLKERLRRDKPGLVALLNMNPAASALETLAPDPEARYEPFPLTDIQRAYWVGRQQAFSLGNVGIHFYTEVACAALDVPRLELAWNKVVARHDMLRAIVKEDGDQQVLREVPWYTLGVNHLDAASVSGREEALAKIRQRMSHSQRATDEWPGFGIEVSRTGDGTDRLHVSIDLLHVDGASLQIIFEEWHALYADETATLPSLELAYRDYVLAELKGQQAERYQRDLQYWRQQLDRLPGAPQLPVLASAEAERFERVAFRLDAGAFSRLKQRAAARGITPTVFVLSAFAEVLRHWSADPSFTLNVTLFNRLGGHPQMSRIVGDFTSIVLLGVDACEGETLGQKALRLQQQLWSHLQHRGVSGIKVLGELNQQRKATSGSIMPVVFTSLLDLKGQGFSPAWLDPFGEAVYTLTQTPQVYLDHQARELGNGGLECSWDVIPGLFPPGVIEAMLEAYRGLLAGLMEDDRLWEKTAIDLTPPDQLAVRAQVNATGREFEGADKTLYQLFAAQAECAPDATALVDGERRLGYGVLHELSAALRGVLAGEGAGPDAVVAVFLRKGWRQVAAVLGVHAAGAAYLPMDVELPPARTRYLLEDSHAVAVITEPEMVNLLPGERPPLLILDDGWLERRSGHEWRTGYRGEPSHLSHVIYTSGSTGKPKGVMVEHRQVVNRLLDVNQRYRVGSADKVLALTALHHDLSVFDVYGPLLAGGQIVLPEADRLKDPAHWLELLTSHQVTLWNSVPAFLEMLVDYQDERGTAAAPLPGSLRFVILAGDWIPVSLPGRVRRQRPDITFIASGGPTETTIWDIYYEVNAVDPAWRSIPYGRPLANSRYHVLNPACQPCPTYVPGELYIAGAGLTRGYLNDPERTAEKFICHPQTGERLYRSGDMGRYLPDGNIEFLGRRDFQIKIRGQRIELAEIEATAKQHDGVRNAVAAVHDGPNGKSLLLYAVPHSRRVTAVDVRLRGAGGSTLADEERDFVRDGLEISDPAQRLQFKMEHRSLRETSGVAGIALTQPREEELKSWRSWREYREEPIPFRDFSRFLGLLSAREGGGAAQGSLKFHYGSAGGLYPVQTYVCIKPNRVESLPAGLFYYHPVDHQLIPISSIEVDEAIHYAHNRATVHASAFSLFFVAHLDAIVPLYGEIGRLCCYLEAGSMAQILRAHAPDYGIGLCQIGHLRFEAIEAGFKLGPNQILLASMVGGPISPGEQKAALPPAEFKAELSRTLAERLPPHMVPGRIVLLDGLPVTANGKVDRVALPRPEAIADERSGETVAPANALEATIAAVWQGLLDAPAVHVERNFFELGANSALIVKAYHRICQRLGSQFPLVTMFRYPTIRGLAGQLGDSQESDAEQAESEGRAEKRKKLSERLKRGSAGRNRDPTEQDR